MQKESCSTCSPDSSRDAPTSLQIQPWDSKSASGQKPLLMDTELLTKLNNAAPIIKRLVSPDNIWAYLRKYRVMDTSDIDDCKSRGTDGMQVEAIIDFLRKNQVWKTHAFFRCLAHIDKDFVIDLVLGNGSKEAYNKNLLVV